MSRVVPFRLLAAQSRASAASLAVSTLIVTGAVFVTAAVPVLGEDAATRQVQQDVASAGRLSDVVVSVPLSSGGGGLDFNLIPDTADSAAYVAERIEAGMPPDLRAVLEDPITTLVGPQLKMGAIDGVPARLRFAYVAVGDGPHVDWVEGRAPQSTGTAVDFVRLQQKLPVEVGLSTDVAEAIGASVGDELPTLDPDEVLLDVVVTGIFKPQTPGDPAFSTVPTLLKPNMTYGAEHQLAIAGLVTAESLPHARLAVFPKAMDRTYTYHANAHAINAGNAKEVATTAKGIASGKQTFEIVGADPQVTTQLDKVIAQSLARTSAAQTQASVLLVALIILIALTQFLAATVLTERRGRVLGLLRIRGGSGPSVGAALAVEAAVVTTIGVGIGLAAQQALAPGDVAWGWVLPSVIVSLCASPVLGMRAAMRKRVPPPARSKRRNARGTAQLRRVTAEIVVVLAAIVSFLALRSRGAGESEGALAADVLVLAAPALCAVAVGVVLARLMPLLGRWLRAGATRLKAPDSLVAAARLRAAIAPTLALVLAGAIVALAASTSVTVTRGLEAAAWDVVGADAVATASLTTGLPAGVGNLDAPGVTTATASDLGIGHLAGGTRSQPVTVIAVDAAALAKLEQSVPGGAPDRWQELADATVNASGALPMLQTADLQQVKAGTLSWGRSAVSVASIGLAPDLPGEAIAGDHVVVVDSADLAPVAKDPFPVTTVWALGEGAGDALTQAVAGTDTTVTTRQGWRDAVLAAPITEALTGLIVAAALVALIAAALGLLLVVAAGTSERRVAMGRLRVIGFSTASVGRVARIHETLPVVLSALVGVGTGLVLTQLLAGALELNIVTGQPQAPEVEFAWWTLALPLVLGALAWLAVGAGVRFGRAIKLGDVMRAN